MCLKLGLDVGHAMVAKVLTTNSHVLHGSNYRGLSLDELDSPQEKEG